MPKYRVTSPIWTDRIYKPGEEVELSKRQAKEAARYGAVELKKGEDPDPPTDPDPDPDAKAAKKPPRRKAKK